MVGGKCRSFSPISHHLVEGVEMAGHWWVLAVIAAASGVLAVSIWRSLHAMLRDARFAQACRHFHFQREHLEAKFVRLGMLTSGPGGCRWVECQFDDDVAYARSRSTGELSAFVAVRIQMEGIPAPLKMMGEEGGLRLATAVFRFDGRQWDTDGRAIFNLTPTEAIHFYRNDLELLGQEMSHHC